MVSNRHAIIGVAITLLVGCGGGIPINGASSLGIAPAVVAQSDKSGALLYVSAAATADVYVFTFPGGVLKQTLTGFESPQGECVDAKGNVFVTDGSADDIVEYAHGGNAPVATLKDPGNFPFDCTVDPTTGELAVTNAGSTGMGSGVVVYAHARGAAKKTYTDAQINSMWFCGYDSNGNLFVDGDFNSGTPVFAELPHRAKTFKNLTLDRTFGTPGPIQWDGTYLAVGDQSAVTIYRFAISGSKGTTKGAVHLDGAQWLVQFWIDGSRVAAATTSVHEWAGSWNYPAGGKPIKKNKNLCSPFYCLSFGATISQ
ncbi:MAG: hypothetical protein WAK84_02000 [Candidatus Cybelea sp.]